jgi:hypothetical protein
MIAEEKIREAELMLARGKLSQRKIAKITGLSRGTISMIANGKRKVQAKTVAPDLPPEQEKSPPVRCPCCGAMVRMPCLLCFLKNLAERKSPIMRPHGRIAETTPAMTNEHHSRETAVRLDNELTGDELMRYREVRAWRENCSNPYFVDIPEDWPWRK